MDQQVDSLRGTLEEMRRRAHQAQKDADQAFEEANQAEANIATLAQEIRFFLLFAGLPTDHEEPDTFKGAVFFLFAGVPTVEPDTLAGGAFWFHS